MSVPKDPFCLFEPHINGIREYIPSLLFCSCCALFVLHIVFMRFIHIFCVVCSLSLCYSVLQMECTGIYLCLTVDGHLGCFIRGYYKWSWNTHFCTYFLLNTLCVIVCACIQHLHWRCQVSRVPYLFILSPVVDWTASSSGSRPSLILFSWDFFILGIQVDILCLFSLPWWLTRLIFFICFFGHLDILFVKDFCFFKPIVFLLDCLLLLIGKCSLCVTDVTVFHISPILWLAFLVSWWCLLMNRKS